MKFKKILALLLSVSMLGVLSACDGDDESSSKKEEVVTETVEVKEESKVNEESEAENDLSSKEDDLSSDIVDDLVQNYDNEHPEETVISIIETGFGASFGENIMVDYDESTSTYSIAVWQEGFADAVETEAGLSALSSMTSTLESSLVTMTEQIRTLDSDANILFQFVSDKDQETVLIELENGVKTYSVAD